MSLPLRSSEVREASAASCSGSGPQKAAELRLRETSTAHRESCSGTVWLKALEARLRPARPGTRQSAEALMSPERPRPWRERETEEEFPLADADVQVTCDQLQ
ncbi:unnamed protein product [Alopecurus aequalis]